MVMDESSLAQGFKMKSQRSFPTLVCMVSSGPFRLYRFLKKEYRFKKIDFSLLENLLCTNLIKKKTTKVL